MTDDLVKRLRDVAEATGPNEARQIALDAADRIEELEEEVGVTRTEKHADAECIAALEAKLAECEARLSKAMSFAEGVVRYAGNGGDDYLADQARATLAELTGGNND